MKIEKLNKKMTIFTILGRKPSMVVEPPVCREPPRADLIRAFTCFTLNAGKSRWAQGLKDLIREPMGACAVLINVVKHIAKGLPGLGPPCPVDDSLLTWINNKHMLHTCNTIVSG